MEQKYDIVTNAAHAESRCIDAECSQRKQDCIESRFSKTSLCAEYGLTLQTMRRDYSSGDATRPESNTPRRGKSLAWLAGMGGFFGTMIYFLGRPEDDTDTNVRLAMQTLWILTVMTGP